MRASVPPGLRPDRRFTSTTRSSPATPRAQKVCRSNTGNRQAITDLEGRLHVIGNPLPCAKPGRSQGLRTARPPPAAFVSLLSPVLPPPPRQAPERRSTRQPAPKPPALRTVRQAARTCRPGLPHPATAGAADAPLPAGRALPRHHPPPSAPPGQVGEPRTAGADGGLA